MRDLLRPLATLPPMKRALALLHHAAPVHGLLNAISKPRGIYGSFAEAWDAAARFKHAGHDHQSSIDMHMGFSQKPRISDYPVMMWLANIACEQPLHVFDFGGNVGNVYYCYKSHLPQSGLRWTVFDLPPILDQGRHLAAARNEKALHFTDELAHARDAGVFLASGSLHYWEHSIHHLLERAAWSPEHVFVNRSPLREEGSSFYTVQVTEDFCVPCVVRNINELIAEFAAEGYSLEDRWAAPELSMHFALHPGHTVPSYSGLYFQRQPRN